jgi:hypothetical protein
MKHKTRFLYVAVTVAASAVILAWGTVTSASTRFISSIVIALVGTVVVVAGHAFSSGVFGWLTFAVGLVGLVLAGVSQLDRVPVSTGAATGIGHRSRPNRKSS